MPGGPPRDPGYWRKYRAAHPLYAARDRARRNANRKKRLDRSAEYARRKSRAQPPLAALYPLLQRGVRLSFWEDELRQDLAQEHELAMLEGRDPEAAVNDYRKRELAWLNMIRPLAAWR